MKPLLCLALSVLTFAGGSGRSRAPVVVGSKNEPEGILLGEMVAQHLERRLDGNVRRQLSLGNTAITYQALLTGQIALYPEYSGLIETEILKETPNPDPAILIERARGEIRIRPRSRHVLRDGEADAAAGSCNKRGLTG